jgi:hypothetical protein
VTGPTFPTEQLTVTSPRQVLQNPLKGWRPQMSSAHGHVATAWIGPQVGVITVVVLSAFGYGAAAATIWGAVLWLASWVVSGFAYAPFTTPAKANSRNYGELMNRLAMLEARRDDFCNQATNAACTEATEHLAWVSEQTKTSGELKWVNGAGYIAIWQRLHRAEEALIGAEPEPHLLDEALHDELRLKDSAIPNRDDLLAILKTVTRFLSDGTIDPTAVPRISSADAARSALKEVRSSINEFRDSSWNGLLQLRNQTMTTLLLTNVTLFVFAVVAVASGARGPAMLAAAIFYLAGAMIGLFNRLYQQFQAQTAIEDYGLTMARLLAIPVYSGLAAVAGVLITVVAGSATGSKAPDLSSVFKIPPEIGLLVVAAAFGAAPDLVLKRLADASEKFKTGIASTEPANRA